MPRAFPAAPEAEHPALDDLHIVSNDLTSRQGFTAVSILRNEIYFLPAFLAHYRALGVGRFVVIDDQSADGSRANLAAQPDVMVLGSARRYGDRIEAPADGRVQWSADFRVGLLWRQYLLDTFGRDSWSLLLDLDEFIHLPEGVRFPDLARRLDPAEGEVVWSPLIDCYPASPADLAAAGGTDFDPATGWFIDGWPHLAHTSADKPRVRYAGVRARLMLQHGLVQTKSLKQRIWWHVLGRPPIFNAVGKMTLQYWRAGDRFVGVHHTVKPARTDTLLPIQHFKFTGALYAKLDWAIQSGAYYGGSKEYKLMADLLSRMQAEGSGFTDARSVAVTGYDSFARTGNARGL